MRTRKEQFEQLQFANDYELVNGVAMHAENGDRFQTPPDDQHAKITIEVV